METKQQLNKVQVVQLYIGAAAVSKERWGACGSRWHRMVAIVGLAAS